MRTEPTDPLTSPEVVGCFFERSFQPPLSGLELRWPNDFARDIPTWHLPGGLRFRGPAPTRFGITIHRLAADAYQVRLLWNDRCLEWNRLDRQALLSSSLNPILGALGTDLSYLLEQPAEAAAA